MIEKIRGQYIGSTPKGIVVDVNGVGYGLEVPLNTHSSLPEIGREVDLWVHTYVREDVIKLFGFRHYVDRIAFEILIGLSGVGPKVALAILSTLTVDQLKKAILLDRQDVLLSVPGIGKRLAEKIFVDLKPKIKKLNAAGAHQGNPHLTSGASTVDIVDEFENMEDVDLNWAAVEDVRSALENLGFKDKSISNALETLNRSERVWSFQDLLRESLAVLGSHKLDNLSGNKQEDLNKLF